MSAFKYDDCLAYLNHLRERCAAAADRAVAYKANRIAAVHEHLVSAQIDPMLPWIVEAPAEILELYGEAQGALNALRMAGVLAPEEHGAWTLLTLGLLEIQADVDRLVGASRELAE